MTHKYVIRKPEQHVLTRKRTEQWNLSGILRLHLCWHVSETSMTPLVKHHQGICCSKRILSLFLTTIRETIP